MKKIIQQKFPAQIMIIVLVLMSIISIIALSATLTSVRNTEEKTQNAQYQAYYSVGEQKLLDIQQKIGREPMSAFISPVPVNNINIEGDTGNIVGTCVDNGALTNPTGTSKTCTFDQILTEDYNNTGTQEQLKTTVTVEDIQEIKDYPAKKDIDMLFDLQGGTSDTEIKFSWAETNVAWDMTVDTVDYNSEKAVYNNTGGPLESVVTSFDGTCFKYSVPTPSTQEITVTIKAACGTHTPSQSNDRMFFRLKPLIKIPPSTSDTVNLNLTITGSTIPLQRNLKSITTTATATGTTGSGNPDNPTVVLDTKYLLIPQPTNLFDYVLRTESDIIKK